MTTSYLPISARRASSGPLYLNGWDLLELGGHKIPGKTEITSGGIKVDYDHKKVIGRNGGKPTLTGKKSQEIVAKITVWTDPQYQALLKVLKAVLPGDPQNKNATVLAAEHPALEGVGIESVIVVGASAFAAHEGGIRTMTLTMLHRPPLEAARVTATATPINAPVRKPANDRRTDSEQRNPKPTAQAGTCGPPFTAPSK